MGERGRPPPFHKDVIGSAMSNTSARCRRLTRRGLLRVGAILVLLSAGPPVWSDVPRVVAIALAGGVASGPALTASEGRVPVLRLRRGETVELRWSSDRATTLHLHGYGLETHAAPGLGGAMSLVARAAGRFPVETHDAEGRHRAVVHVEILPE